MKCRSNCDGWVLIKNERYPRGVMVTCKNRKRECAGGQRMERELYKVLNIPHRFRNTTELETTHLTKLFDYYLSGKKTDKTMLLLSGDKGIGKTTRAYNLVIDFNIKYSPRKKASFINSKELIDLLYDRYDTYKQKTIHELKRVKLLVIDEVGSEIYENQKVKNMTYNFFNERYAWSRDNIFLTNLDFNEIGVNFPKRLLRRINTDGKHINLTDKRFK